MYRSSRVSEDILKYPSLKVGVQLVLIVLLDSYTHSSVCAQTVTTAYQ